MRVVARRNRRWYWWGGLGVALLALSSFFYYVAPRIGKLAALSEIEREGDVAFQRNDDPGAEVRWRFVLGEMPRRMSVRNKLAVLEMRSGRYEKARALLEQGIELSPETPSYHFNLAVLDTMQGDLRGALASLDRVEALNPMQADVHFLKGVIYERLGRPEQAQKEFIKQLNCDPDTPAVWARAADFPLSGASRGEREVSTACP